MRIDVKKAVSRYPKDTTNAVCTYDKIYPWLLGHTGGDVNVTFSGIDAWGNIMLAGQSTKFPYSFSSTVSSGYIALIDSVGLPYWVYYLKDVYNTNGANICTYMRHFTVSGDTNEYLFAMCNIVR